MENAKQSAIAATTAITAVKTHFLFLRYSITIYCMRRFRTNDTVVRFFQKIKKSVIAVIAAHILRCISFFLTLASGFAEVR